MPTASRPDGRDRGAMREAGCRLSRLGCLKRQEWLTKKHRRWQKPPPVLTGVATLGSSRQSRNAPDGDAVQTALSSLQEFTVAVLQFLTHFLRALPFTVLQA
jgi:hypothetical protein